MLSCAKEPTGEIEVLNSPQHEKLHGEERAIKTLIDFIEESRKDPQTKSTMPNPTVSSIKKISASAYGGEISTKSSDSGLPIYEFSLKNADDTYGYAIVTDDDFASEVLAYVPNGSISDTTDNKALALYFRELAQLSEIASTQASTKAADYMQPGWENILYSQNDIEFLRWLTPNEELDYYANPGNWRYLSNNSTTTTWNTYVPCEWHQRAPYNNYAEFNTYLNEPHPIGCFSIAAGQIMAFHGKYDSDYTNVGGYNWPIITAGRSVSPTNTPASHEVATLLKNIAVTAKTRYSGDGGSVYNHNVVKAFNELGWSCDQTYLGREGGSMDIIREEICDFWRPVLYSALLEGRTVGHYWVVDGYRLRQVWKYYPVEFKTGYPPVTTGIQFYRERLAGALIHCNWGWGGESNGWFYTFTVPHYSATTNSTTTYNFTWDKYIYTNIKPL